jgi:sigma-B regulation protein RsbU (phosphoserine phosphatase)
MKELLELFAETEIFIFVFTEIVVKIPTIQLVIFHKAALKHYLVFIIVFGAFSVFGTLVGIHTEVGAVSNIRDFAPLLAGVIAGPYVGLAVGLIGGIHRFFMGGITCVPCSISTVLAGLIGGLVYLWNKKQLIGIVPAMLLALFVEALHGAINLLMVKPFDVIFEIIKTVIPPMMVANSLGMAIGVIIVGHVHETRAHEEAAGHIETGNTDTTL